MQQLASGQHKIQLAPSNLATGTYIVTLISDSRKESKKLVVRQ
ncbi:MAG: T9SS type A sorting domain-containing protein [Bacteroidota bacterium]